MWLIERIMKTASRGALTAVAFGVLLVASSAGSGADEGIGTVKYQPVKLDFVKALGTSELDKQRGVGVDTSPTVPVGGEMQLGVILWDELKGKRPPDVSSSPASNVQITVTVSGQTR